MKAYEKVAIIGSGNWGSAIAKIIGKNTMINPEFDEIVPMWVFEETIDGKKLTEIINTTHENVKYLPNIKLPENIVAVPDVVEAAKDATLLVFVTPHQFVKGLCQKLKGKLSINARAISLIKGIDSLKGGGLQLISDIIKSTLEIECSVLMGANIANEVALENFCEATIGYSNHETGLIFQKLFNTSYFRVNIVQDIAGVELCGALKNVVAVGAGFVDGLRLGDNTKAAIIRIGLMEMKKFCKMFYQGVKDETFLESCGVADLITTCSGGRNRKVSEAKVLTGKSLEVLEKEMLNGQKLQGPLTALDVYHVLSGKQLLHEFPLFVVIYRICYENWSPMKIVEI